MEQSATDDAETLETPATNRNCGIVRHRDEGDSKAWVADKRTTASMAEAGMCRDIVGAKWSLHACGRPKPTRDLWSNI